MAIADPILLTAKEHNPCHDQRIRTPVFSLSLGDSHLLTVALWYRLVCPEQDAGCNARARGTVTSTTRGGTSFFNSSFR